MQPFANDDTQPVRLPVCVQAVRACRPAITRITGVGMGETFAVPPDGSLVIGRSPSAAVRVDDAAVSREHARIRLDADGSVVLEDLESMNGTVVNGGRVDAIRLTEGDKIQVGTSSVFRFSLNDRLDETYLEHLYQRSIRDTLTGLFNRRYLYECLDRDLSMGRRHDMPMAVLLLDADHFKDVNDEHGHAAGDEVLRCLAALLGSMQRTESILARYGGEEFAVLLRNVSPEGAEIFAERMRESVERSRLSLGDGYVRLTVSVGVAVTTTDGVHEPDELLACADRYLYHSKARGRNRVTSARTAREERSATS